MGWKEIDNKYYYSRDFFLGIVDGKQGAICIVSPGYTKQLTKTRTFESHEEALEEVEKEVDRRWNISTNTVMKTLEDDTNDTKSH